MGPSYGGLGPLYFWEAEWNQRVVGTGYADNRRNGSSAPWLRLSVEGG